MHTGHLAPGHSHPGVRQLVSSFSSFTPWGHSTTCSVMGCPFAAAAGALSGAAMQHCPFLRSIITASPTPFKDAPTNALLSSLKDGRSFLDTYTAMHGEHGVIPHSGGAAGVELVQRTALVVMAQERVARRPQFASMTLGGGGSGRGSVSLQPNRIPDHRGDPRNRARHDSTIPRMS